MKEMAVQWREHLTMICIDDKAVVPIGEPDAPMSTGVRSHNRGLVAADTSLVACDHDFLVAGLIPSVLFKVQVSENAHYCKRQGF